MSEEKIPLSRIYWKDYLEKQNYNKDTQKMCQLCRAEQIEKYGEITIPCKGLLEVPKELKPYKDAMSDDEYGLLEQMYDPYKWAERNIKPTVFQSRWYQEQVSRCSARNVVSRAGRRIGKSVGMAIKALHRCYMNPDTKILMLAPQEVHVKEFAEIMDTLVYGFKDEFGDPNEFRIGSRQKPYYEIRYSNGSRFRGIIASDDGKSSRGQKADVILLDEVDFLGAEALVAIMAIRMDNPDVELWVSSTPKGKRNLFKFEQNKTYKTWHFPSFVIPHYSDALDKEMKDEYGEGIGYMEEVLAVYADTEDSVFQKYFVEQATVADNSVARDEVLRNRGKYLVNLGVDWNDDKNGTRLYSVAFDIEKKKMFTVEKSKVAKEGWTQVDAVQKLIDLNRVYNYDKIYLDSGYGVSNTQFIKKYAQDQIGRVPADHPDLRLSEVVAINFGSNLEFRDVENPGKIIKENAKSYLVENAIRYIERSGVILDKNYDKELIEQVESYCILRVMPDGRKIYGKSSDKIGDHDLDAWMLALLAFTMEYQEIASLTTSDSMMALSPRDTSASVNSSYFLGSNVDLINSKYNNLFVVVDMNRKKHKSNEDFYDKYVLKGRDSLRFGLSRTRRRSQF